MTIKNRIRISSLLYVAVTLATGLALIIGLRELQHDLERDRTSYAVVTGLLDLTTLTDDYLRNPAKRSLKQWQARSGDVGRFLEKRAGMEVFEPQRTNTLIQAHERINSLFSQLMSLHEKIRPDEPQPKISAELMNRLKGMLDMELQSMVSDASQLYRASQTRIDRHLHRAQWVIILFFGVTALIILGNHIVTRKSVIEPLGRLTEDTAIIGKGDLDHVVDVTSRDEMGDLAQAFNRMTAELKRSYEVLETEIRERKLAQEELTKHRDHLEELVRDRTNDLKQTNENLLREIEERKRIESDLLREKNFSDLTIDSLPGIFYLFDSQGKFLRWNKNFERVSGYSGAEISGMGPLDFFAGEDQRIVGEAVQEVFTHGASTVEADFVSKDGTRAPYFLTGMLANLDDMKCLLGTGIDISDLKRAHEELAVHARALEIANAELQQFAYISSHHLQEPLRKVINYAELLHRRYQGQLDDRADRYIGYVVDGSFRMRALIEDLLTLIGLDRAGHSMEKTDLDGVMREVVSALGESIRSASAVATWDELPSVTANPAQLKLVLQNLVGNGIKFHGSVPPQVHISAALTGKEWVFAVRDNGIGIAPQYHEQIFNVFERLHPVGKYSGTGMGLALCKKIVERHGGRIWLESQPGEGSVFRFTIPSV